MFVWNMAGIAGLEKELSSMGGPPVTSRGGMVHLILSLCRQFEEAFGKAVDGGKGGGEQILRVFEERLGQNIQSLAFKKVRFNTEASVEQCATDKAAIHFQLHRLTRKCWLSVDLQLVQKDSMVV